MAPVLINQSANKTFEIQESLTPIQQSVLNILEAKNNNFFLKYAAVILRNFGIDILDREKNYETAKKFNYES